MNSRRRIGVWLIGAKGGVGTTAQVGIAALARGLVGPAGMVSELPQFAALDLVDFGDLVVGGHDVREGTLYDEALRMHTQSRAIDPALLAQCRGDLEANEQRLRVGTLVNVGPTINALASDKLRREEATPRAAIERIKHDLEDFAAREGVAHTVVVNVASTEPGGADAALPERWDELEKSLESARSPLAASSLYAIAALDLGCSYINFTPSTGATPAAISELAERRGSRHMGYDGKTGETLLKSTLAPMFAHRNLEVMSWVGHNIFGNMDGKVLDDPSNKKSKVTSKDQLLKYILGYTPQTLVSIEYIASMGDWKTAWDHIHFKGFLGTPMTLQFTWQGCDSLLAAPLVLDLVRFAERAWRQGEVGVLTFLSSFFKSPLGVDDHNFERQFQALEAWSRTAAKKGFKLKT